MLGAAARALEPARCSTRCLPRTGARALPRRAVLAVERARRRLPAPARTRARPRTTASAPTCGRSTTRAAPRCASRPSAWRSRTCPTRTRACRAARRSACTTPRGRRARRATSAPAGTSTTCATTTSRELFGVDPMQLRYADHERYLALGRVVTGEVMARAFGEWRRARSTCRGGWSGSCAICGRAPGWGVVDATGAPRRPSTTCRRAFAPLRASHQRRGQQRARVHVVNDRPERASTASSSSTLYRAGEVQVGRARRRHRCRRRAPASCGRRCCSTASSISRYAYRFGPPSYDLVVATLRGPARPSARARSIFPPACPRRASPIWVSSPRRTRDDGARRRRPHAPLRPGDRDRRRRLRSRRRLLPPARPAASARSSCAEPRRRRPVLRATLQALNAVATAP